MNRQAVTGLIALAILLSVARLNAQGTSPPAAIQNAADVAAARDLFREASRLAKEGKWEEARAAYERSYALRPSALTRYGLGMAQKETKRFVEAIESFRAFLRHDEPGTADYRPSAEKMLTEIEGRVARLTVSVVNAPHGVEVVIDGAQLLPAAIGVSRPVDPGSHKIEARAPGYEPYAREVELGEAATSELAIEMKRAAVKPGGRGSAAGPGSGRAGSRPTADSGRSESKSLGIALTVTGGAVFIGGVAIGLVGVAKASNADTRDGSDASSAKTFALVGDVVGGLGLVTAAVGAYVLLSPSSPEQPKRAAGLLPAPWLGRDGAGVAWTGAW